MLWPTTGRGLTRKGPASPSPFSSSCPYPVSLEKNQDRREAREGSRVRNVSRHSRLGVAPGRPRTNATFNVIPQRSHSPLPGPSLHLCPCGQGHQARNGEPLLTSQSKASVSITATQTVGRGGGGCLPLGGGGQPEGPAWSLGWTGIALCGAAFSAGAEGLLSLRTNAPAS